MPVHVFMQRSLWKPVFTLASLVLALLLNPSTLHAAEKMFNLGPIIRASGNCYLIPDGRTTTSLLDGTDISGVKTGIGGVGHVHTIRVHNQGLTTLTVSGISVAKPANQPSDLSAFYFEGDSIYDPIAPGTYGRFGIRFKPTESRDYNATFTVVSNDPNNPDYAFAVHGFSSPESPDKFINRYIQNHGLQPILEKSTSKGTQSSITAYPYINDFGSVVTYTFKDSMGRFRVFSSNVPYLDGNAFQLGKTQFLKKTTLPGDEVYLRFKAKTFSPLGRFIILQYDTLGPVVDGDPGNNSFVVDLQTP